MSLMRIFDKFSRNLAHHDNRDFEVLPSLQPRGQPTFNEQTLMINSPGVSRLTYHFCSSKLLDLSLTISVLVRLVEDIPPHLYPCIFTCH